MESWGFSVTAMDLTEMDPKSSPKLPWHIFFLVILKKYCLHSSLDLEKGVSFPTSPQSHNLWGPEICHWDWQSASSSLCGNICLPACGRCSFILIMKCLTVWMSSVTHSFFSLFYFPIHLITYPLVHSCLAQSHSLNNYLGRTFIIELYGRSRFRKNKSWCVNNILWGFSEHYFILSLSWEAKGQETWLPLHFVTAGSHG